MNDLQNNEGNDEHIRGEGSISETQNNMNVQGNASQPIVFMIVIAFVVVILSLVYMWGSSIAGKEAQDSPESYPPELPLNDTQSEVAESAYTPDTLEAIERDLLRTDIEGVDAELDTIESELDTLLEE